MTTLEHNEYPRMLSIQATEHPSCGARFGRICKTTMKSPWWCTLLHHTTWIYCYPFHMSCGSMDKVWQLCDTINALGCYPTKPLINQAMGPVWQEDLITIRPSPAWCMLLHEEPQAIDGLPHNSHVLWVHGQGLTSLGRNQYNRMLFIETSEHPSCETRFGENCKTTQPSSGLSMLLGEEPQGMDGLPTVPYVLWVHMQGLTSLGYN